MILIISKISSVGYPMASDCFYPFDRNVKETNLFLRESNLLQVKVFQVSYTFFLVNFNARKTSFKMTKLTSTFNTGLMTSLLICSN